MAIHEACRVDGSSVYIDSKLSFCHFGIAVLDFRFGEGFGLGSCQLRAVECLESGKSPLIFNSLEPVKIERKINS